MSPLESRQLRMLAQSAFEDAHDFARDGDCLAAIKRAQEGINTLAPLANDQPHPPRTRDLDWIDAHEH